MTGNQGAAPDGKPPAPPHADAPSAAKLTRSSRHGALEWGPLVWGLVSGVSITGATDGEVFDHVCSFRGDLGDIYLYAR